MEGTTVLKITQLMAFGALAITTPQTNGYNSDTVHGASSKKATGGAPVDALTVENIPSSYVEGLL